MKTRQLDNFSANLHIKCQFIDSCSWRCCAATTLEPPTPENCEQFVPVGPCLGCQYENSNGLGRRRAPHLPHGPNGYGTQAKAFDSACTSHCRPCPSCQTRGVLHFAKKQGVSHAEWPKDTHECAASETGSAICWSLGEVVSERRPPRTEAISQRAKKL
jgi:hypothetical protein